MSLRTLSIAPRAALGFGLVALLVLLLGAFSLFQMTEMRKQSEAVDQDWLPSVMALGEVSQDILRLRAVTLRLMLNREPSELERNLKLADDLHSALSMADSSYEKLISSDVERGIYVRFRQAEAGYLQEQAKIVAFARQGNFDDAIAITRGALNQHADEMTRALRELSDLNRKGAVDAARHAGDVFESARTWVVAMMVFAALATVVLALLLTRSIVAPLTEAVRVAEVVASGDLTQNIHAEGDDEPACLLNALKSMQQSLRTTIQSIPIRPISLRRPPRSCMR